MRCITHSLTHTLNNQLIVSLLSSRRRQTQKASHLLSDSNKCSDDILLEKNSHVQVVNERPRTHTLLLFLFFSPVIIMETSRWRAALPCGIKSLSGIQVSLYLRHHPNDYTHIQQNRPAEQQLMTANRGTFWMMWGRKN